MKEEEFEEITTVPKSMEELAKETNEVFAENKTAPEGMEESTKETCRSQGGVRSRR